MRTTVSSPPTWKASQSPLSNREMERTTRPLSSATNGSGQSNVFARLQSLFPHNDDHASSPRTSLSEAAVEDNPLHTLSNARRAGDKTPMVSPPDASPFLKIKIITWNMHESLPHGDLRSLLGSVPPYVPVEVKNGALPLLPEDDSHPFHMVIVAGQECPTHSGIPLGLGATFKDRHKEKEKQPERGASRREREKERERQRYSRNSRGEQPSVGAVPMSGWSAILEDWLQEGVGSMSGVQPALREGSSIPNYWYSPTMESNALAPPTIGAKSDELCNASPANALVPPYLSWNVPEQGGTVTLSPEQARLRAGVKGPYVLLCKERLLGIYIAIFVHRDCRSLVRGYSTNTVTAGLMGGRVGNKGGVGVSLSLAGTRLLFINAHLAAHEGKVALRLANLHKIKSELEVDAFLPPDDARLISEDVTDRFDYTFIFGDLNFRLDLSRLHADWLISRKDYAQALEFDQLHNLIRDGTIDFQEEPPSFPPTYKYDVRRRSMRDSMMRRPGHRRRATTDTVERLDETDEQAVTTDRDDVDAEEHENDRPDFESSSFVSTGSAWTGTGSTIWTTDADDDDDDEDGGENVVSASLAAAAQAAQKLLALPAAQKAKTKFMDFLGRPVSPAHSSRPTSVTPETLSTPPVDLAQPSSTAPDSKPAMTRSTSTKTHLSRVTPEEDDLPTTYDSSSKQRVPSWCDRILWKSTIVPEPELAVEYDEVGTAGRGSLRRGYLGSAWPSALRNRGFSGSSRRNSASTMTTTSQEPDAQRSESPSSPFSLSPTESPSHRDLDNGLQDETTGHSQARASASSVKPRLRKFTTYDPLNQTPQLSSKWRLSRSKTNFDSSSHSSIPTVTSPPRLPPVLVDTSSLMPTSHAEEPKSTGATATSSRWWHHIPGLLSRSSVPEQATQFRIDHRRGDVVVLSYKTLDDGDMRSLDGRSDHRPVIGAYAVYI